MRRLLRWVVGLVSAFAVWRWWSRRRREPEPETPDPADELRRKLAATRTEGDEPEPGAAEHEPVESLDERRARVHAKAQEAIDAMQEGGE